MQLSCESATQAIQKLISLHCIVAWRTLFTTWTVATKIQNSTGFKPWLAILKFNVSMMALFVLAHSFCFKGFLVNFFSTI